MHNLSFIEANDIIINLTESRNPIDIFWDQIFNKIETGEFKHDNKCLKISITEWLDNKLIDQDNQKRDDVRIMESTYFYIYVKFTDGDDKRKN